LRRHLGTLVRRVAASPCRRVAVMLLTFFTLLTSLLSSACRDTGVRTPATSPISVQDDAGRSVQLKQPARRVVSLVPSATDIILALGAGDRLVARTEYDRDARLAHLPNVGGGLTASLEWLAAAKPDLVIAWPDQRARSQVSQLTGMGIPVYASGVETLAQARSSVQRVGAMLGLGAGADSLNAKNDSIIAAVHRRVLRASRPRVLYAVGFDPPFIAGPHTFIDELIGIAGGSNVFADAKSLWPQVSLEEIVRRQPDVVIVAGGGSEGAPRRLNALNGWRELNAVKSGRTYTIDASVFNRPGPNVGFVATQLERMLHPELQTSR
jgi:ABC-type Fe3+-hydroxamate transport system substrate-binding protein